MPAAARWLALGASTGGPAAVHLVIAAVSRAFSVRILVVQHISRGFDGALCDWLAAALEDDGCSRDVHLAEHGERPPPGSVRIAPAGSHLRVTRAATLELDGSSPPRSGHRPSVDELFLSLATVAAHQTAAALLSGMGPDGAAGLLALRLAGGHCLAQSEDSSPIFGMARAARDLGARPLALPPPALGVEINRWLSVPLVPVADAPEHARERR
jgi:two-component system chemotaxis response regulator CheB